MIHPPKVRSAPPTAVTAVPAVPAQRTAGPPAPPAGPPAAPRRAVWAGRVDRLRAGSTTEPGRLRLIAAALALLVIAFGAATAWESSDRYTAADDVVHHSNPLSKDAADIYRSLADADTEAVSAFLASAETPSGVHKRYQDYVDRYDSDIRLAAQRLAQAAASTDAGSTAGRQIQSLNAQLPVYTGLIQRAQADNQQGLPLGGAYLRYANQQMNGTLLPTARRLYAEQTARLRQDSGNARAWPYVSIALGVVALGVLVWTQRRDYRRTNRVFNRGMLVASTACTVALLWLLAGQTVARADLGDANTHGGRSLAALDNARIDALTARANENLSLVSRGSVADSKGNDQYGDDYAADLRKLGADLATARGYADDPQGRDPLDRAGAALAQWRLVHRTVDADLAKGDFDGALEITDGDGRSTGQAFDRIDSELGDAISHEEVQFRSAASAGRDALSWLSVGAAVLAALAAATALTGMARRLSEYR